MNNHQHEQLILSCLNNKSELEHESFTYRSIFLNQIVPDPTNARFLPAILIDDEDAKLFTQRKISKKQLADQYEAEDHVLIGQSCLINCLKYDTVQWKKANQSLESIIELGNNIQVSELIQAPTIYPLVDHRFQILTGHRRFFALIYSNGYGSAAQFKLYDSKPLFSKVKQFQENASREDLPQFGKLNAFLQAIAEIDNLNRARLKIGLKKLTVKEIAAKLGISMGAYDNYNVLTRYACVIDAYESGLGDSFVKTKKMILEIESNYKATHQKMVLNIGDKHTINDEIESALLDKTSTKQKQKTFNIKPIKSPKTVKTLLTENIMDLDTGIDWHNLNWEDHITVSNALSTVIRYLEMR